MSGRLEGKVALVTGAASGIGRATALLFGEEGARVVVADVDDSGNAQTAALIEAHGAEALHVHCDASDPGQVETLVDAAVQRFGRLDCAFNNAGIGGASAAVGDYELEA